MLVTREMLFPLAFYQKTKFHGSRKNYNYRIEKYLEEGKEEAQFLLTVWEGPECYDASSKEKKKTFYPFSEEGMEEIVTVLNQLSDL
ncbi:MAG: hypothetical protein HFH12_09690 [Dorea sp.]|nr:hypothetical protein [Dorea sp.]